MARRRRESRSERRKRLLGTRDRSERAASAINIPDLPNPVEIARNLPASAGRMASEVGSFASDAWDIARTPAHHLTRPGMQSEGEQLLLAYTQTFQSIGSELWRSAMDPNAGLLTHLGQAQQYPHLSQMAQGTPFGPGGWGGFVSHIEQNPAEWGLNIGLSAMGAGGIAALRQGSRFLPVDTPAQRFARQWNEVDLAYSGRVPSINAPERHGGGRAIDIDALNAEAGFLADDEFLDIVPDVPMAPTVRRTARPQSSVYDYDSAGSYSGMDWRPPPKPRPWGSDAATRPQLKALERMYPERDYTGITKGEASNILSFDFLENIYEGNPVDYARAAELGIDLPDTRSVREGMSFSAPEYVQRPDVLEWSQRSQRPEGFDPMYNLLHRGPEAPSRGSAQASIYGDPAPPPVYGPHPRGGQLGDYHSGEIETSRYALGAREVALGGGVSLAVGGGVYGWQHFFGGEPAYTSPTIPHFSETERAEAIRQIEGGGDATEGQKKALARMYPDKDLSGLTKKEASELFDNYERPARTPTASGDAPASDAQVAALARGFGGRTPAEPANWLNTDISDGISRNEASHLFASLELKRIIDTAPKSAVETEVEKMATDAQVAALNRAFGVSEPIEPANWLNTNISDGISARESGHLFASLEVRKALQAAPRVSRQETPIETEDMATEGQLGALGRIFPDMQPREVIEPANWLNVDISDGISKKEASHLFASAEVKKAMAANAGPEMATEGQLKSLRRMYPGMFPEHVEPEMTMADVDPSDGISKKEASFLFSQFKPSPELASYSQLEGLRSKYPNLLQRMGGAQEYLETGGSYFRLDDLRDIYDADTFLRGTLHDVESGQVIKGERIRVAEFDAPEIQPDLTKPKEYRDREAARAVEARDIVREYIRRFNEGRNVDEEGYIIPVDVQHLAGGQIERGIYGRALASYNFPEFSLEHALIRQGLGSVYGSSVDFGAEQIDVGQAFRTEPTFFEGIETDVRRYAEGLPEQIATGLWDSRGDIGGTLSQVGDELKALPGYLAKRHGRRVLGDFATDLAKNAFRPEHQKVPLNWERYVGSVPGLDKLGSIGGKFLGSALAPLALAAGTFYIGEKSLDAGYEEVIDTEQDRVEDFEAQFYGRGEQQQVGGISSEGVTLLRQIERIMRRVLSETSGVSDRAVTAVGREIKTQMKRGVLR